MSLCYSIFYYVLMITFIVCEVSIKDLLRLHSVISFFAQTSPRRPIRLNTEVIQTFSRTHTLTL